MASDAFDIFLVAIPGLEKALCAEAVAKRFAGARQVAGGVVLSGGWPDVWRANLELRGASRVLARIGQFRALHLAQLDKRARAFPWRTVLRNDVPVAVEATCRRSKIYHSGAAAERIARAIADELGAKIADDAEVIIKARIEDDLCTISIDSSGEMLHKRGAKQAMAKAPIRETMASLFLRECGFDGREPLLDPMCGAGTFVIEAAEMAMGLNPGRARHFAFEKLVTFDAKAWEALRNSKTPVKPPMKFYGSDRDDGAIQSARANAARAGVADVAIFERKTVSDVTPPDGGPGLVICNPPYGTRISDRKQLADLYSTFGRVMRERFKGWRVGMIASNAGLAKATGLPFKPNPPAVLHGGLRIHLYRSNALK